MPAIAEVNNMLARTRGYLTGMLLPFWLQNARDPKGDGFLTYFDRHGRRTGKTDKTFLMQIRTLYTMASAHRAGYGGGRCAELAREGARFIVDNYWDSDHDGWFWIADRAGTPTVTAKVGYGQCFGIYAFSEYALATGDEFGRQMALRSYDSVCRHMIDTQCGGYRELFRRDWTPMPGGRSGGDRKSLDVHMHMMEALTTLYELTGRVSHRRRLEEVISLITERMLDAEHRLGLKQFSLDFTPLRAIIFDTEWGRDAPPEDDAQPLDMTSPGHNVELAWLLLHAADVLGLARADFAEIARRQVDHCCALGIDWEYGGVYADVPMARPPAQTEKQFWQQCEALVGLLDAVELFGNEQYWTAFRNVYDFVFDKLVVMDAGGEWYERVDRFGSPIDDALGHAWKINYHTVRSMIQTVKRLEQLVSCADTPQRCC